MPGESFPQASPAPEVPKEKKPTKTTRREFLKRAVEVGTGAALLGANFGEDVTWEIKENRKREFSWPELQREMAEVKNKFGEKWQQEMQRRIRTGVDRYFRTAAEDLLREKNTITIAPGKKARIPPGAIEGSTIALLDEWMKILAKSGKPLSALDGANKTLLFGSAGAGIGFVVERLETILREKDPPRALQKLKQGIEDYAYRALILEEGSEENPKVLVMTDFLTGIIQEMITENKRYLRDRVQPETMLEYWGAGASITSLPTKEILKNRGRTMAGLKNT